MIKLYERYNTGDNATTTVYGANWLSETFTPATAHKVAQFRLKLIAVNNCGTITVSLQATDANGKADGTDLITKTVAQAALPIGDADWEDIDFTTFQRVDNVVYAIVVKAPDGYIGNYLGVRYHDAGTYTGGSMFTSSDSGSTWTAQSSYDIMFEDWGEPVTQPHDTISLYLVPAGSGTYTQLSGFDFSGLGLSNWELVDDPRDAPDEFYSNIGMALMGSYFATGTLTGTVTWTNNSKAVTGSGCAFTSELADGYYIRRPDRSNWGYIAKVASIQNDDELTLVEKYDGASGADTADETEYSTVTKKDSYSIKSTKMQGTITGVAVWTRCVIDSGAHLSTAIDGAVTPFLRLNSTDLDGSEWTVLGHLNIVQSELPWVTFKEAFTSRPSGGVWSWEDFDSLEVGHTLEAPYSDQNNYNNISSTQCLVVVTVAPLAGAFRPINYDQFTEFGLLCFDGYTEVGYMISDSDFTWIGRAVFEYLSDFVADPVSGSRKASSSYDRHKKSNRVVSKIQKSHEES